MLLAALALFAVVDLGEVFSSKSGWSTNLVDFVAEHVQDGFVFASRQRDVANSLRRGSAVWLGRDVWEARVYAATDDGGVQRVEMSLYNTGDRRPGESYAKTELAVLVSEIQARYGVGAKTPKPEKERLKSGGCRFVCSWTTCDPSVELAWGVGEGKNEEIQYVRVTLSPRRKNASRTVRGPTSAAKIRDRVRRNAEGDVWIDGVPMVDQGEKGYCAAAVSERILRYFGCDIDEHEVAQQSGGEVRGTRVSEMIEAVRAIGAKRRLVFGRIVASADPSVTVRSEGSKKPNGHDARVRQFLSGVRSSVDKGIPVCWGVELGLYPESGLGPQLRGGHMRLIVGYNAKTREILYSDSWGAGHELKRMPEDQALAITHDAFFLRPH